MTSVNVHTPSGEAGRSAELPGEVFDAPVNVPLMHQVVTAQLAAGRQGTHDTKTRGQRRGGGAKPFRQKGTGRARQGSIRAPQFLGGGVVHGPAPRSHAQKTPKKMKAAALSGALSDRAGHGRVYVVSAFVDGLTPSTKAAASVLGQLSLEGNVLAVVERSDRMSWLSLRNHPRVHLIAPDQVNPYDVLVCDDVVFTEGSLADFVEAKLGAGRAQRPARGGSASPAEAEGSET